MIAKRSHRSSAEILENVMSRITKSREAELYLCNHRKGGMPYYSIPKGVMTYADIAKNQSRSGVDRNIGCR
jgi:hypothetical protein